jgi:hypothetical protein
MAADVGATPDARASAMTSRVALVVIVPFSQQPRAPAAGSCVRHVMAPALHLRDSTQHFGGGAMKATMSVIALALTILMTAAPVLAECELGCGAECKQEAAICGSTATLEARIGRQLCQSDAADALAICDSDAIDARADCVGMCGPDLKECGTAAKSTLKSCKEQAKIELAGCENEVATLLAADKTACAEDAADCASTCVE